ncbi:hypothetical protein [uncultured Photobacterium sp.]|uniref:hypothetical protein n=1 Tax=uncultured Photobacterium sp. TaxID=173973 RepID=UPI002625105E|nr:hypothetical protein [uncultured Photobacterium sp.]
MKNTRKKRLFGIAVNAVLMATGLILSYMNVLGIIPMIIGAFSAIALFANATLYIFKYDEDDAFDDTAKVVARAGVDGLTEFIKK